MNPKPESRRFFSGIVKKAAGVAGVQFVNEPVQQPQTLQKEFATAPTVAQNAPVLGEVKTTPVNFDQPAVTPAVAAESPLAPTPAAPELQSIDTLNAVPPVPEVPKTPVPDVIQTAFQNAPENTLNPTIIPASEDISATISQPAVDAQPVIVPAEPVGEAQNTVAPEPPAAPEEPLVHNPEPEEPVIVSPSMATPEVVVSDRVSEESTEEPEARQEVASVPSAVEDSFTNEPEDHLDPSVGTSEVAEDDKNSQGNEFNVMIDPIADELIKNNPDKFIKVGADGKLFIDKPELDAEIFAQKVLKEPNIGNLFKQLKEIGVTPKTAQEVITSKLKSLRT